MFIAVTVNNESRLTVRQLVSDIFNTTVLAQHRNTSPAARVTDSDSDGIRHFFMNPKSVGYLKSDRVGFAIFVSEQL